MADVPNSIDSNITGTAYAEEETLKTLAAVPAFFGLEPNSFSDFGGSLASVARSPITANRQRAKGTTTDLDAKAGFNSDLTQRNLTRLLQGFFFADAIEKPATNKLNSAAVVMTAVADANPDTYSAAAGLGSFVVGHLIKAKGFAKSANNGVKHATIVAAGLITVSDALAAEAAPPAGASLEAVGYRFPAGDLVLTVVGNTLVLTSAAKNPTTLGLTVGEWIYVGGDAADTFYAVCPRFFGRIKSISATQIILDCAIGAAVADAGAAKTIEIYFGKVLMNAVDPDDVVRRSYHIERTLGDDGDGTQAEYVVGAVGNELTLNVPSSGKPTIDLTFVGMDVETVAGAAGPKSDGKLTASPMEDPFNTSNDLLALRINVIDPNSAIPDALFAYATDLKLTIKNNASAAKALAVIGGFDITVGEFAVDGSVTAYFSTVAAAAAMRANSDCGLTAIFGKHNAGLVIDVPLLGLGNGSNKVEKDKKIMTELTQAAGQNAEGYTLLMSFFEYLPDAAMPA